MTEPIKKEMPTKCPSCSQMLKVAKLHCGECGTAVEGSFNLSTLSQLSSEDQNFIVMFIKANGSLKDIATAYGVSYPTVRNMLDALIEKVKLVEKNTNKPKGE